MQRILPPALVAMLAVGGVALHFLLDLPTAPSALRWFGVPIGVLGLGMTVWGSNRFGAVGTNIKTFDQPDVLVSDGLFRWSRNPMYLGFTVALAGLALGLGSLAAFVAPAIFTLAADRWYIPFEEEQMKLTFREDYDDYAGHVRRWLGRRSVDLG